MRKHYILLLFILLVTSTIVQANKDSVNSNYKRDTSYYRFYPPGYFALDTDTSFLVKIDSNLLTKSTAIFDSVMLNYQSDDYSYLSQYALKNNSNLKASNNYKLRKPKENWISFLIITLLTYLTIIRVQYAKNIPVLFQAYWNDRVIGQFTRDDNFFKIRTAALFFLLFCAIFALLLYNVLNYFENNLLNVGLTAYYRIFLIVNSYYLGKYLLMKLSGYLFSIQKVISGYLAIISVSNLVYTMIIIPILLFYQYLPVTVQAYLIYVLIFLWVFNTFYKYLRSGSFVVSNFQFPKFYLFLYLCSLEIMPLLVIYKLFII